MRGMVPELASPHPVGMRLPALYLDDDFAQRYTSAFDDVLAPVFATLDSLASYLDPRLAPEDFVDWLAGWVALSLDENWSLERRRELVARAVDLHRWRGTARGLAEHLELVTGGEVEIRDSGGCAWSATSGGPLPGDDSGVLHVLVQVPDPGEVDPARLEALIAEVKPAHLTHTVEIVASGTGGTSA